MKELPCNYDLTKTCHNAFFCAKCEPYLKWEKEHQKPEIPIDKR